uniref:MoaB/Mog domain-containing protein n=1 Tax=Peronospora matthiolae TaxID=2874970 RepID=A0AAV1TKZ7_9STRA
MLKGYDLLVLAGGMISANSEAISGLNSKYLSSVSAALTVVTCDPQATSVELYIRARRT